MPSEGFAHALLAPDAPVPTSVKGRSIRRFAVYRNNVVVGLMRAIESNFPAIRALLGETYFAGLAREYVMVHPPKSPLMFHYGDDFPAFLAAQEDLQDYAYLPDVARVEILMRQSHHASDAPVLSADALAGIEPDKLENLRFIAHPAARMLASGHAIGSITMANRGGTMPSGRIVMKPEAVIITRPKLDVGLVTVSVSSVAFLQALLTGQILAEAAESAFQQHAELDVGHALGLGLAHGLFTSLQLEN